MSKQVPLGKVTHFMYTPFTGLGLYKGFRGNAWLSNRIKIFKQFVVPALQAQTNNNFILWCSWRYEEKNNKQVIALKEYLDMLPEFKTVFTYSGVCFYDDKYPDTEARFRLLESLHGSMGELINVMGECDTVLMTITPSDDIYSINAVAGIQNVFKGRPELQGFGFSKGYVMNYVTKELAEYNPTTNPPFYTISFPREIFVDALKHAEYTSMKREVGQYKVGTPLPSHEYVGDCVNYGTLDTRGFLVGCHGANISTTWQIPFKGRLINDVAEKDSILQEFNVYGTPPLKIKIPLNKRIYFSLPYKVQRKLRYWVSKFL